MRKLLVATALLLCAAGLAIWLEPTRVVWGWLRGEAFYDGRPSSYWAAEIERWRPTSDSPSEWMGSKYYYFSREPFFLFRFWPGSAHEEEPSFPKLFEGDPAGACVLDDLVSHSSPQVRLWAVEGIKRIKTKERGPRIVRHRDPSHMTPVRVRGGVGP